MTILEQNIANKLLEEISASDKLSRQARINEYSSFLECIRTRQFIEAPIFNPYITTTGTGTTTKDYTVTTCCSNSATIAQNGGQE